MATIKKQGRGYQITVSTGYDAQGRRHRQYLTWVPSPGMTERQIERELARQAALFEERVRNGAAVDAGIRFSDFAEKFMTEYAELHLKPKTVHGYRRNLERINQAIGHIRLNKLRTAHINAFYRNLQEEGVREQTTATARVDLAARIGDGRGSLTAFAARAGLGRSTVRQAMEGKPVSLETAQAIAGALGMKTAAAFSVTARQEPLAPATVMAYHRLLSSILTKAVKWGYLLTNPAANAEKPKQVRHEADYLDEKDARRLLEALQQEPIRWRALIAFDLLSGLRRSELLGLRWEDVDLDGHTIQIRQTSQYLPEKGVYTETPKSHTSARPLRLSTAAVMVLLEYRQWQDTQREKLGDAWQDRDHRVFTTEMGAPVFPDSPTQWFHDFTARAGLPDVTIHSLRHTYATLMIADNVPLVVVSKQLGHAQTSTTANIYAHAIASAQAKAMETFDRFNDLVTGQHQAEEKPSSAPKKRA